MLDIDSLIWVIPGIAGLWAYNRYLSISYNQIEGWAYLFTVVFFAAPSYYLFLKPLPDDLEQLFYALLSAIFVAIIFGSILAFVSAKFGKLSTLDPFADSFVLWRRKLVFITLKNNDAYFAILLDYTRNPKTESVIKVRPVYIGYRDDDRKFHWTLKYPVPREKEYKTPIELIIPKREIVTFSHWSGHEVFTDTLKIGKPEKAI